MKILYFAKLRQHLGKSSDSIKISDGKKISDVINELKNKNDNYRRAFDQVKNLQYALNCEYVDIEQTVRIKIFNLMGSEIYKEEKENFIGEYIKQINLEKYNKGVYLLEIYTQNGIVNKKLILQ